MPPDTLYVSTPKVSCDGNGHALEHPKIYLTFDTTGKLICPYCSRTFILQDRKNPQKAD